MEPHTPWRAACRELALQRAHNETRQLWDIADSPAIANPFDYRGEHVQQVVQMALHLARLLDADREVVEAAAWLHDIRKMEKQHAAAGAAEAATFLPQTDFPAGKIDAVVDAIAQHEGFYRPEGSSPIAPLESAILWDADKLTKLGVGAVLFSFASPYVRGKDTETRYHYIADFVRDVLSRTVVSMNTEPARAIAAQRYAATLAALQAWREELEIASMVHNL